MVDGSVATADQKTPARAWAVLVVVYIASFMAPMAQFKVPPLASWIIPTFQMTGVSFGYMMSALSIIGVILAFPAAWICRKMNLKNAMIVSVVCLAIGTLIGALTSSYEVMLVGRMVEGVGIGLIGVAAPACIAIWFPEKTRGTALGIWASWFPVGITLMFNIAPAIAGSLGWRAVYWVSIIIDAVALILFVIVFKMPSGQDSTHVEEESFREGLSYLKNSKLWILALIFFIFNFIQLGVVNTFYNTFLVMSGLTDQAAASITSVMTAIGIPATAIGGLIFDRIPKRHKNLLMIATYVMWIIGLFFAWGSGDGMITGVWVFIIVMGIANGFGAGSLRPYAPMLMPATAMGATMAMATLQFMQNLGAAVGAPVYGWAFETLGWSNASNIILIPLCVIAIILACFLKPKKKALEDSELPKEVS